MKKIQIINGPNLNLLGKREPTVYGNASFEGYLSELRAKYPQCEIAYFQSNVEGEMINKIHDRAARCNKSCNDPGCGGAYLKRTCPRIIPPCFHDFSSLQRRDLRIRTGFIPVGSRIVPVIVINR